MTSLSSFDLGWLVASFVCALWLSGAFVSRRAAADEKERERAEAQLVEQIKRARPPMPPAPPQREGDYFLRHISHGRDTYGQVLETIRLGSTAPAAAAERCEWCLVKLTRGACTDGCGAPQ